MEPEYLIKGNIYFVFTYSHPKYPIPEIVTYVFIGKNIFGEPKDGFNEYVFQRPQKYFENDILNALTDDERNDYEEPAEPNEFIVREDVLDVVADLEGLINRLRSIKDDHFYKELFKTFNKWQQ